MDDSEGTFSYSGNCGDDATYSYDTETKTLTISGTGKMWNASENSDYRSYPWSNYRTEIERLEIGEEISFIANSAFSGCISLESLTVPNTVDEIGVFAFAYCENLSNISVHCRLINQAAFCDCSSLTQVDLTDVEDISWHAFTGCDALTAISIPETTAVLWQPFYGCMGLESINVSENNPYFMSVDGVLFNKITDEETNTTWSTILYCYPPAKTGNSYEIPSTITEVYSYAFSCNQNLVDITFPSDFKLDENALADSYYIEHWWEQTNAYAYASGDAYYLVIDNTLLDIEKKDGTSLTSLNFTNYLANNGSTRWITDVDFQIPSKFSEVTSVISDNWVNIQYDSLRETQWFKNSDLNVIYNNVDVNQATYKLLYSYHGNNNELDATGYTSIGSYAFSDWNDGTYKFDDNSRLTIYLNSEGTTIQENAFSSVDIEEIYVDGTIVDVNYLKIESEMVDGLGATVANSYDEMM